jgi:hypothetical protein
VRVLALFSLIGLSLPAPLLAQGDTALAGWVRFSVAEPLQLQLPRALTRPWDGGPRRPLTFTAARWDSLIVRDLDSLHAARVTAWRMRKVYGRQQLAEEEEAAARDRNLIGLSRQTVDIGIDGNARIDIRTEKLKNHRCTSASYLDPNSGCRGGFKSPRLDTYLQLRSSGVIGQRLHLDVDFDTERDFTATNNLKIYYQGLEDEIVRRVEIGTVEFRPPPSRFLTASIPANNFGVNAAFELGPVQLEGIVATQKGSQIATRVYTVGATTVQPQDRQVRDIDYEAGRFFWVVDPQLIPGYPRVDILQLNGIALPPAAQVSQGDVRVYRYRPSGRTGVNPNLGGINAIAIGTDTTERVTAEWELLQRDLGYYVDPSGLWVALSARLDPNDYLAVSYRSGAGQVGTFPATDAGLVAGQPPRDTLLLIVQPKAGPQQGTFRREMRHIYRVAGSDLDLASLRVNLLLNRSEAPLRPGAQATYLAELGLAVPSDPEVFNTPERVFPRLRDPGASLTIKESYIVFPVLAPFADTLKLLATERNDSLYRTPGYLLYTEGPPAKFVFRLRYNASSTGDRSALDLGALQIRDGSETLVLNGRRLERGVDYSVNYDLGQVSFLDPAGLFGAAGGTIQASFEERGIFAVAPTKILGFSTRYNLGQVGGVNLVGVYQAEESAFNRPQLGFEASAQLVGGISTDLRFRPDGVTRFVNRLTSTPATAPSRLDVNAELALSRPDPNRSGAAYLEEFEGDPGVPLSLRESVWEFGSIPQYADGVQGVVGSVFDPADAVQLTWQNLVPEPGTGAPVQLRARDIDPRIQVAGQQDQLETVLYLTLHPDTAGGQVRNNSTLRWTLPTRPNRPRWRSLVTGLSSTGVDLSKNEYLEFWVYHESRATVDSAGVEVVIDLGNVSEDAIAMAPETLTVVPGDTLYSGRQLVGLGRLDTERQPSGIFNAESDDIGILGDRPDTLWQGSQPLLDTGLCKIQLSTTVLVYPWGDLGARCTNGNGFLDTEDLDGDNQLNATGSAENVVRWVVDLRSSQYFVRTGVISPDGSEWRLYRIPLRAPEFTLGTPNLRLVKHLRFTVVGEPDLGGPDIRSFFAFARMRFLGAPWFRRSESPVSSIAGSTGAPLGDVVASSISTENTELGYTSPPGVVGGTASRGGGQGEFGSQVNERSLRVIGTSMMKGQRAEAYYRFPSGPQNLLRYRELRAWARGRGPGWDNGDFEAYIRVGSDANNFYQYSVPASTVTWLPEMAVQLDKWRELRAAIEQQRLTVGKPDSAARVACGGDTLSSAYVLCSGPYLVHILDPAVNPPNLAEIQELAAGVYRRNANDPADSAEVWIDDLRLIDPISRTGTAFAADARLVASDAADFSIGVVRQDGYFQQLGENPSYRTTGAIQAGTGLQLHRFLPAALGILMPVNVSYSRSNVDPLLLTGTDINATDLDNLRKPESWALSYGMALRRSKRSSSWLMRGLVDPVALSANFSKGQSVTELSEARNSAYSLNATYNLQSGRKGFTLDLGGVVDKLPGFLRNTDGGNGVRRTFVNLAPSNIRLSSGLSRAEGELRAFQVPIEQPSDTLLRPYVSLSHLWRNSAGISFQPLGMLQLSADLSSTRDLRDYEDSTTIGRVAKGSRRQFLGMDVGVERDRQLGTSVGLTPQVTSWLRPRYVTGSSFGLSRNLTSRQPVQAQGDTAGEFLLPQTLSKSRFHELGASVDLARLLRGVLGDSSAIARTTRRLRPFDISDRITRTATFDPAAFDPSLGFQLGLGGLDAFLTEGADSAVGASELRNTSFSSGADLPLGLSFALGYGRIRTSRFQAVPGSFLQTETFQREWPKGNVRLTRTVRGLPISTFGLGTTFRTIRGHTLLPSAGGTAAETINNSSNWAPDARVTLKNGMALMLTYSILNQENTSNGNSTRTDQKDLTSTWSYAFQSPVLFGSSRRTVRTQVTGVLSKGIACLEREGEVGCETVSDNRRKEARATLDADLARILTGGLQFSYSLIEAKHLDRKFSQIVISASFQVSLYAGDYR